MNNKKIKILMLFFLMLTLRSGIQLQASDVVTNQAEEKQYDLTEVIEIEDVKLDRCVRTELALVDNNPFSHSPVQGDITIGDLQNLTKLNCSLDLIDNYSEVRYLINLNYVVLSVDENTDLSPFAHLEHVNKLLLYVEDNSELPVIENLTSLTELSVYGGADITDLSTLSHLVNLEFLSLYEKNISDISPLSSLTNLEWLSLDGNQISDITPLSNLTNLETLHIKDNQISDLTPLAPLENMKMLGAINNQISDLSPLENMKSLDNLAVDDNQISDISVLENFEVLNSFTANSNQISDLTPLSELYELEYLFLDSNQISDLTPLENLNNFSRVRFNSNQISDLSPLNLEEWDSWFINDQKINLDSVVYTKDMIYYEVTDLDGTKTLLELGTPTQGNNTLSASWSIGYAETFWGHGELFAGTVTQNVTYVFPLVSLEAAKINQKTILTDSELLNLFEVESLNNKEVSVDASLVNFEIPGEYDVTFTDSDGNTITTVLNVLDVLPQLSVDKEVIEINVDESKESIVSQIYATATEVNDGDLNSYIVIDDSNIDYNTVGEYQLLISVSDNENNVVEKVVKVIVVDNSIEVTPENTISGKAVATISEHTSLDDIILIELFNVTDSNDEAINVNASEVQVERPGTYTVFFTNESGQKIACSLIVSDMLPVLNIDKLSVEIKLNGTIDNVLSQLVISASEITEDDLTENVKFDDSDIDYNTVGEYQLISTVSDNENNVVNQVIMVTVVADSVDIKPEVTISGNSVATVSEHTSIDEAMLIDIFSVTDSNDEAINVNASEVQVERPGTYTVFFTNESGQEIAGSLIVSDVLPVLDIDKSSVEIEINGTLDNVLSQLVISASEITEGDLTENVEIDDSNIDYNAQGVYKLLIHVQDIEANKVSKTVTVSINEKSVVDTESELKDDSKDEDDLEELNDNSESADSESNEGNETISSITKTERQQNLASTGNTISILAIIISLILFSLIYIKAKIKE